ncbi:HAD family phosphatase [Candidatus Curtissbacteria bacterium]|nr:HAD family phosphatase [Candidatus Curtissbacteria bacterium]
MYKAIIFDLDGLLIDSEPVWHRADDRLFAHYGIHPDVEFRSSLTGRGQRECAKMVIGEFKLDETVEKFCERRWDYLYQILDESVFLMNGAREIVEGVSKKGYLVALATGGHEVEKAKELLNKTGIISYFDEIVSGLNVKNSKPEPDIYITTAEVLGVQPEDCVVLEDAVNGVLAGKAARMKVIGVNIEAAARPRLKESGADEVFENLIDAWENSKLI